MSSVDVPSVGELLAERYRLDEHVGGADGGRQLWQGTDILLHRTVAVVLRSPGGEEASHTLTAAVAASRAAADAMVGVYDAVDEGRFAYVVREWVDGSSLREVLQNQPLRPTHALELVASVADAVAALHAGGVTHGCLHPGSILLSEDDRVMVTEPRNEPGHTQVGDVRALGATLYACLTGAWPQTVPAENVGLAPAPADEWGRPLEAAQVNAAVPASLSRLTSDLLDAAEAPPSAAELAVELRRLTETGGAGPLEALGSSASESGAETPPAGMKRLAVVAAVAALVVFAGVVTSALIWGGEDDTAGSDDTRLGLTGEDADSESDETSSDADAEVAAPTEVELEPGDLRIVDPPPGDRQELEGVEALIDGNAFTGWSTNTYRNQPNFGNLKPGMGVLIDLGQAREVASVRIQMTSAGATVGLMAGDEDPGNDSDGDQAIIDTFSVLAEPVEDADTNLELKAGDESTRYVLVWITELPPSSDGFKLTISDLRVFVR